MRTDGVHCRESTGTESVNLKVIPDGAALAGHHGPVNMRLSFPHPLLVWSGHVESTGMYKVQWLVRTVLASRLQLTHLTKGANTSTATTA